MVPSIHQILSLSSSDHARGRRRECHPRQRHAKMRSRLRRVSKRRKRNFPSLILSETTCIPHHEEHSRHLAERFLPQVRGQDRSGIPTVHGWTLRVLSPSMVVLATNVLSFQTLSRFFQWTVPVGHGVECCRGRRMGRQSGHDRVNCFWDCCQRMVRIQEFFHQDVAYTTCENTLIELRSYVWGLSMEEFDGFLIKMQTLDDTITDLTPPTSDKLVKQYDRKFHHCPVTPKEHKLPTSPV